MNLVPWFLWTLQLASTGHSKSWFFAPRILVTNSKKETEVHTSPLPSSLSSFAFLHTGPPPERHGILQGPKVDGELIDVWRPFRRLLMSLPISRHVTDRTAESSDIDICIHLFNCLTFFFSGVFLYFCCDFFKFHLYVWHKDLDEKLLDKSSHFESPLPYACSPRPSRLNFVHFLMTFQWAVSSLFSGFSPGGGKDSEENLNFADFCFFLLKSSLEGWIINIFAYLNISQHILVVNYISIS